MTPTRLRYVREKEEDLFRSLISLTNSKQNEIQRLISQALAEAKNLIDEIELNSEMTMQQCTSLIQHIVINRLNELIMTKLFDSIEFLRDNYVGTLRRCVISLEMKIDNDETELSASKALQEVRFVSLKLDLTKEKDLFFFFQILRSAYQVNISLPVNSSSLKVLLDRMKEVNRDERKFDEKQISTEILVFPNDQFESNVASNRSRIQTSRRF